MLLVLNQKVMSRTLSLMNQNYVQVNFSFFPDSFRVWTAWLWLKQKLTKLLYDQGLVPVPREVTGKQKEMMVDIVRGVPRAKLEYIVGRSVSDIHLPHGWL